MKSGLFHMIRLVLLAATLHVVALPQPGIAATVDPAVVGPGR